VLIAGDPGANGTWGAYDEEAVAQWVTFANDAGIIDAQLTASELFTNQFAEHINDFDQAEIIAEAEGWTP
jgi:hypothetical protein